MGRLFWKFFAFVWLAQLAGIVAVGMLFWLAERREASFTDIASGPLADIELDAAAAALKVGGVLAFDDLSQHGRGGSVYAIDAAGRDIMDRPVPPGVALEVQRMAKEGSGVAGTRDVAASNGRRYSLVAVRQADGERALTSPSLPPGNGNPSLPTVPLIVTLGASILTAWLLASSFAKPIRTLRAAFEAAACGDLDRRTAPEIGRRRDELADLGRDFDRMAARLQTLMQGQRRLLHDVSHELRSPLARLQAAAGLIRQNPDQLPVMTSRIDTEIARIDRLVGELLTLSRLESGEFVAAEGEVDMHELVQDIVSDANFEANAQAREVIWQEAGSVTLQGRSEILHSAIENVVRNALQHAPESRVVRLETSVDTIDHQYVLRVIDDGPGIPEGELPDLFTPFFRGSASTQTSGYGLGLAIARRSIEVHGGTIRAHNQLNGGLTVEMMLPLKKPAGARSAQTR